MKTSELINELIDSLRCFGDLPTNIKNISWYCPVENGNFEQVNLNLTNDSEVEILDAEDEFEDIDELENYKINDDTIEGLIKSINTLNDDFIKSINQLIKNQKKIIKKIKEIE